MNNLDYNISEHQVIDFKRTFLPVLITVILTLIMFITGIKSINRTNSRLGDKINESGFYKSESEKLLKKKVETEKKIALIRKQWNSKIKFVNGIVLRKSRNFLSVLDYIEKILPESISVTEIEITNSADRIVNLSVVSYSTDKLYELYKKLLGNRLDIRNEIESQDRFKAKLRIKYPNEKK